MRVLHIIAGDMNGGAARGAYWLHLGISKLGIDSKILNNGKNKFPIENTVNVSKNYRTKILNSIYSSLDVSLASFYRKRERGIFSTGFFGFDLTKFPEYEETDIIHLHWINGGFVNIKYLTKIKKSIVWTIRDIWPFTGGCHYNMRCKKYQTGCGKCDQLNSGHTYDLSKWIWTRKKKYFPKTMKIVGISNWISQEAKKSLLFRDFDIRTIHNCINSEDFSPIEKKTARKILGIKSRKRIILMGAIHLDDSYKGYSEYIEKIINHLNTSKYFLCFFGNISKSNTIPFSISKFEYKHFGFLNDIFSLNILYSASDVFISFSKMEPFGKIIIESMACGTPVVCFDVTGHRDIITHKLDGYKAKPFEVNDVVRGIEWIVNNENYAGLCRNSRKKVVEKFDCKVTAKQYAELYREVLDQKKK